MSLPYPLRPPSCVLRSIMLDRRSLSSSFQKVPRQIADVTAAHVEEFDRQRQAVEDATPPYSIDELM